MKTLLVTSAVTFVPKNYDDFVLNMARGPHLQALIVIDNRSWRILLQALALIVTGAAPRLGLQLFRNSLDNSLERKIHAFESAGKKVHVVSDINSESTLKLIQDLNPDLIFNARTRSIFKRNLLTLPKLGCLNIHHGLLPDQRGLMCDFWAHLHQTAVGFSLHEMTSKLDDGSLLKVVEVPTDKSDYLEYLEKSSSLEAQAAQEVLDQIARQGSLQGNENKKTSATVYRRNPTLRDFYKLRMKGVKI